MSLENCSNRIKTTCNVPIELYYELFCCIQSIHMPCVLSVSWPIYCSCVISLNMHIETKTNGHHLPDDISKCIFLNENVLIPIKISLKFVLKGQINNIPALVSIIVWRRPGDKPLSEPRMERLLTRICVTRPQ